MPNYTLEVLFMQGRLALVKDSYLEQATQSKV